MLLTTSLQMLPDRSVVWLLGIFLCSVVILYFFIFRPVLRIMDRRRALTDGVIDRAQKLAKAAVEIDERVEGEMGRVREEGAALRIELRRETEESVADMLEQGHVDRDLILARSRDDQARLRARVSEELAPHVDELAELVAAHALIRDMKGST